MIHGFKIKQEKSEVTDCITAGYKQFRSTNLKIVVNTTAINLLIPDLPGDPSPLEPVRTLKINLNKPKSCVKGDNRSHQVKFKVFVSCNS